MTEVQGGAQHDAWWDAALPEPQCLDGGWHWILATITTFFVSLFVHDFVIVIVILLHSMLTQDTSFRSCQMSDSDGDEYKICASVCLRSHCHCSRSLFALVVCQCPLFIGHVIDIH